VNSLQDGKFIYTNILTPTQEDFEKYGMGSLEGIEAPISKVSHVMAKQTLGSGFLLQKTINKNDFRIINMEVK
jgi:hypothetical protein